MGLPVKYVIMTTRHRLHGYQEGVYTLCKQWRCGHDSDPVEAALFMNLQDVSATSAVVCKSCVKLGMVDPAVLATSSGGSSSASTTS